MMYLKLNADYKQGELVPLLDDAIYVYCDVCKSLHRIEDVSHAAFGSCSFEQLNACEKCSEELQKEDEKKQIAEALCTIVKQVDTNSANLLSSRSRRYLAVIGSLSFIGRQVA